VALLHDAICTCASEIGDRARDASHPVDPPSAEPPRTHTTLEQRSGAGREWGDGGQCRRAELRVAPDAPRASDLPCPATRTATAGVGSPGAGERSSSGVVRRKGTTRSKRSRSGPESRRTYRARAAGEQRHVPGAPPSPQGHGFIAPTRRNRAVKSAVPFARLTRTTPSSSGWRNASSTVTGNSPISSKKRTPWLARLISPGRIDADAGHERHRGGTVVRGAAGRSQMRPDAGKIDRDPATGCSPFRALRK
jgi:hypothetical protein